MSPPRVAVAVFPGTNSEEETVDACRAAGMDARLFWWTEPPAAFRAFDAYVFAGGFAHEDRIRAGAIAAKSALIAIAAEEAAAGKPVLGLCNGAQILVEAGLLGPIAIGKNMPARHFQCRLVPVRAGEHPARCTFTQHFSGGQEMTMVLAHGEGRFCGELQVFDALEAAQRIVLRYAGRAPNGALHDAAGICNARGNVLALMPHPERAAWNFNIAFARPELRNRDVNETAASHGIFLGMARGLGVRTSVRSKGVVT